MSLIARLTPTNLQTEKEKFMADQTYNPQFEYEGEVSEEELVKYGLPKPELLEKAREIVDKAYSKYQTESKLLELDGPIIPQQEVDKLVNDYLKMHKLEEKIKISWSSTFLSRASITPDTFKLKSTATFRKQDTIGLIYHEIGTHALRRINYEQQPWFKKKKKNGLTHNYLITEEGLAGLHSLLPRENKSAYSSALRYLAVDLAQRASFVELWGFLTPYVDDLEKRWMICVRQKRGVKDTSLAGGFSKDLVYFQGINEVYNWLTGNDFNLKDLYLGKISYHDVDKAKKLNPDFIPILPSFYLADTQRYSQEILRVGIENDFDTLPTKHH